LKPQLNLRLRTLARPATALAALAGVAAVLALGSAHPAAAVVGNCTPDASWGTLNSNFASQVVTLVNQHRQAMGLSTLSYSPTLNAAAQWKSLHMAGYQYMTHDDPAPPVARTVSDRLAACGYPIGSVGWGENIAYGYSTPDAVMTAWLNSPGHKANIENPSYRAIGVAAALSSNGRYYWTQDFGTLVDSGTTPPPPTTPAAPTVSLTSVPGSTTTSTSASFGWSTAGSPTSTTCSLDGGASSSCTSPKSYSSLAAGTHRFTVTVSNSGGSNSASYTWTVSAPTTPSPTAPTVSLTSTPQSSTTSTAASFSWSTTGSPTSTTCSLDGGAASACTSPKGYSGLAVGSHRFVVTVSNTAGSQSASYNWTVTAPAPAPPPTTTLPTVKFTTTPTWYVSSGTFAWTTTGSPTSTTCSLDGQAPRACTSPTSVSNVGAGFHQFNVTVSNSAGSSTATYFWYVLG
jgi:uncharacterized protein YkwD